MPLRFVTGPVGAGKTTAIVSYLATRGGTTAYLQLRGDEELDAFRERLATALGIAYKPASFAALLAALATLAPCEIALDDIDRATAETLEELGELIREAPLGVSFVYAARSRTAIDVRRYLARGLGAMLEGPALAFDPDEVARLAELHELTYAPADVARFLEETEGWPLVATCAIREAAGPGGTLAGSYDRWRRANARHFREFIDDELSAAGDDYRNADSSSFTTTTRSGRIASRVNSTSMRGLARRTPRARRRACWSCGCSAASKPRSAAGRSSGSVAGKRRS